MFQHNRYQDCAIFSECHSSYNLFHEPFGILDDLNFVLMKHEEKRWTCIRPFRHLQVDVFHKFYPTNNVFWEGCSKRILMIYKPIITTNDYLIKFIGIRWIFILSKSFWSLLVDGITKRTESLLVKNAFDYFQSLLGFFTFLVEFAYYFLEFGISSVFFHCPKIS